MATITTSSLRHEDSGAYNVGRRTGTGAPHAMDDDAVIARALDILMSRLHKPGTMIDSPQVVRDYLRLRFAQEQSEVFAVMWLDTPHRLIDCQVMSHGTIDGCAAYKREIIKAALAQNAAACVLVHNHPSGDTSPSNADLQLTAVFRDALGVIGVQVLDHMIVGGALSPSGVRVIEVRSMHEIGDFLF